MSNAIKYVHGKYLFFADQDDLWVKNKVSVQVEYLKRILIAKCVFVIEVL